MPAKKPKPYEASLLPPKKAILPKTIKVEACAVCKEVRLTLIGGTYGGFMFEGCVHLTVKRIIVDLQKRLAVIRAEKKRPKRRPRA